MSTDDDAAPSCVHFWGRNFITSVLSTMYFLSHSFRVIFTLLPARPLVRHMGSIVGCREFLAPFY